MSHPAVIIISGGAGVSGEQVTRTALAQFEGASVPVEVRAHVESVGALETIVAEAETTGSLIVHTLVDAELRGALIYLTHESNVVAVDLIGPLLRCLTRALGQEPLGQPGLYRQLHNDYFRRIEAIEFTVAHDDGRKPHELDQAEIVLTGVSRTGKTPLSMYLSTRGWPVANVPLVPEIEPPAELFTIDRRRVVGLTIDPHQLLAYRRLRQSRLGTNRPSAYTDPDAIEAELRYARLIFRRGNFAAVNITDKPIEESADDVIALVKRRLRG